MKNLKSLTIIVSLVLCLMFVCYYCNNNTTGIDDDVIKPTPTPNTTYQVYNNTGMSLSNVSSYYYDGDNVSDLIMHGTLSDKSYSDKVNTKRKEIGISFYFNGEMCIITNRYAITNYKNNILELNGNTKVFCN